MKISELTTINSLNLDDLDPENSYLLINYAENEDGATTGKISFQDFIQAVILHSGATTTPIPTVSTSSNLLEYHSDPSTSTVITSFDAYPIVVYDSSSDQVGYFNNSNEFTSIGGFNA